METENETSNIATGSTGITGPYVTPKQTTETLPLYGGATGGARGCCQCFLGEDEDGGNIRIIVTCFITFALAVTIALAAQINYGDFKVVPHGSVATDSHQCSIVGTKILMEGGNAVDAAIASTFCLGVLNPHVTGLGSGGFMLVYDHRKKKMLDVFDFREVAPSEASPGVSVGVPGLLRGLALAHRLHGHTPWKDLVMPSAHIARYGFQVPASLVASQWRLGKNRTDNIKLREFTSSLEAGKHLALPALASTLDIIANHGADVFYNGSIGNEILLTVLEANGTLTPEDLANYQPIRQQAKHAIIANFTVFVPELPSGGPFLLDSLQFLQDVNITAEELESPQLGRKLVQVMEQIYNAHFDDLNYDSKSKTPDHTRNKFWRFPEAVGSHVGAIDVNDIYVSVVSGLNTWWGSQLLTNNGFVLNNALDNFDEDSTFSPGKRPFSLATPVIAIHKNRVCGKRLVLGAGDATILFQVLTRLLFMEENITRSIEAPRFHMGPADNLLQLESWHDPNFSAAAATWFNHSGLQLESLMEPYQSCNVVEKIQDNLISHSDSRGGGVASRF